jgi:HEPN domain-containing protein
MTKEEHIKYWIDISEKDWEILLKLYESKDFVYCLFFGHLVIEKLSKAIWVKNNTENIPPRSHNNYYILDQSKINLSTDQIDFLLVLNEFNIESRYPDYKQKIFQITTKDYFEDMFTKIKEIREWLLNLLQ